MLNGNDIRKRVEELSYADRQTLRRRTLDFITKQEKEGECSLLTDTLMMAITSGAINTTDIIAAPVPGCMS